MTILIPPQTHETKWKQEEIDFHVMKHSLIVFVALQALSLPSGLKGLMACHRLTRGALREPGAQG